MKNTLGIFLIPVLVFLLHSCNNENNSSVLKTEISKLETRNDSLSSQLKKIKKQLTPGVGPMMLIIQAHHTKLGLAIRENNWKLVNFELEELEEDFISLGEFYPTHPEFKLSTEEYIKQYVAPAIEILEEACTKEDKDNIKKGYNLLTSGCNGCHQTNGHDYNVIIEPSGSSFLDQNFKVE